MTNTINEYNKRVQEIEIYFNTLKFLDKGTCVIQCTDILGNYEEQEIDSELSKILKAHGFLLLYNLIEATIRKSIDAILNSIHSTSMTYQQLSEEFRKLWIKQENKGQTCSNEKLLSIVNSILNAETTRFKEDCVYISGNIDAQEIRNIMKQIGGNEIRDGRNLKKIKDQRNHLAHGEFSFAEIGKDYTVQELIEYKESAKLYLNQVLTEIQDFIAVRKFAK